MLRNKKHSLHFVTAGLLIVSLVGCSAQYIRDQAQEQIKIGQYEKALKTYQDGLAHDPDNVVLRAGEITARDQILTHLINAAAAAHGDRKDEVAAQMLARALAIRPNDDRARSLQLEIERDDRMRSTLESVREHAAKGMRERAMIMLETALKDSPQNGELLALKRQWELESRQAELTTMRLAEVRPISLDFRDANLRMVLDVLTRNSGINFVIDKDVRQDLRTTALLRQTRFSDALDLITSTSQLSYKVIDSSTVLIYPKTPEKTKEYQDLLIRAFYLTSADVKQTAAMLKTMLKIREPFIDEKLNMIMVRETPETVRMAERLIALHDLAEPEVMMEMEVLEVQDSSLTQLGVNYPDGTTLTPLPPTGSSTFTLGNLKSINRNSIGITVPSVQINLHRDVGNVNILANPKIRARNREKAKILIGDKLPIVTTTGSASNGGFISESVQYVDVGLKLDVEPTIYLDDEVAIKIGLEVSSLEQSITTAGGSLVYQLGTRNASTVLRLRDGETQLLAGLINNQERMSANRIPGIGDLPVIGRLFASQRDQGARTEIVLSITPHIVRNIRRPDLNQTEFWSGTENDVHSRALAVLGAVPVATIARDNQVVGVPNGAPSLSGAVAAPVAEAVPPLTLKLLAPAEVKVGDTFAVYLNAKAVTAIRGIPAQLNFSNQNLQLLDIEEGAFFTQDGSSISKTKALEQPEGRASMAILRSSIDGVKGDGTVLTLHFKAVAAGSAQVALASAKVIATPPVVLSEMPAAVSIVVK